MPRACAAVRRESFTGPEARIEILPRDLSQEGGELTPTLKVKRSVVADKYEEQIEALYAG